MLMQTDNEDGPQTLPHQHRRPQTSHRSARGQPPRSGDAVPAGPAWAHGLRVADSPPERPHTPSPAHPRCPGGRPPARVCGASSSRPLTHTQNGCSEDSGQQRGHRGADQRLDRHTELRPGRRAAQTQTQHAGACPRGARPEPRPPLWPEGLRGRKVGPGQQQRRGQWSEDTAGSWWRVVPQPSRRRPAPPGEGCTHLRNSAWPAWW